MAENDELSILHEVYEDLLNLGYSGEVRNIQHFILAFKPNPPNHLFLDVASWLSIQLSNLLLLHDRMTVDVEGNLTVDATGSHAFKRPLSDTHPFKRPMVDKLAFFVELSVLLEILACPIKEIMSGNVSQMLNTAEHKIVTVEYLIQELRAAKVVATFSNEERPLEIHLEESEVAKQLKAMLLSLNFSRPPNDIKASVMFQEIDKRVCALSQPLLPDERVGEILFSGVLTESQWFSLEKLYAEFFEEYRNRREMDITRVSVTISSFLWKDTIKKLSQNITNIFSTFRERAVENPDVEMSDMIAATASMDISGRVSSDAVCRNTHSAVNRVTIGNVPDRGGRPNEQAPPPPEIPSWLPRSESRGGRSPFPASRGRPAARGPYIQAGADPRSNRPVEIVAPMQVAGDNFAQFGNVPVGMGQHALQGHMLMNPGMHVAPANIQNPPPNWGVPPGRGQFGGQRGRGMPHAFRNDGFVAPYARVAPNAFHVQGAHGGANDGFGGQGAQGGPNVGQQGGHFQGGPNVGQQGGHFQGGPNVGQQGGHFQRGFGRVRGGRGNPGGFGGFGGRGGY